MCSHIHATVLKCRGIRLPNSDVIYMPFNVEEIHHIMSLCSVHGKPLSSCSGLAAVSMLRAPAVHGQFLSVDIVLCFVHGTPQLLFIRHDGRATPDTYPVSAASVPLLSECIHTVQPSVCEYSNVHSQQSELCRAPSGHQQNLVCNSQQVDRSFSPTGVDHTVCDPSG